MSNVNDEMKSANRRLSRWARHTAIVSRWWEDVSASAAMDGVSLGSVNLLMDMGAKARAPQGQGPEPRPAGGL